MAARFWVGGTGTWDNSTTTHWAASSNGAGGQSVPGVGDTVTFDASSGGGTVSVNYNFTVTSITMGAFTGTLDMGTQSPTMDTFNCSGTGTRTLLMGTGTWSLAGSNATIWTTATATNLTLTPSSSTVNCTYSGGTGTRSVIMNSIAVNHFKVSAGTDIFQFLTSTGSVNDLDFTGFAGTWAGTVSLNIAGSLTISTGLTRTAAGGTMTFTATSGTKTITSNGKTIDTTVTFNGVGGTWQLADDFSNGATRTTQVTNGIFTANNFNLTTGLFASNNSNTRTVTMGSGTWTLIGTGTVFNFGTATGLTFNKNTSTLVVSDTSASTKTISVATGVDLYNVTITGGGTGSVTLGNGTTPSMNNFTVTSGPKTVIFTSSRVYTINGTFLTSGSSGNLVTLQASGAGNFTLTKPSGIISVDYVSITKSTATGGAQWYAGANSTDAGSNTGWIFTAVPTDTSSFLNLF